MTPPENGKPLWTESQVESVLEEFFQQEMPPDLRRENPTLPPQDRLNRVSRGVAVGSSPSATPSRANSLAGLVIVGFSTLLMLMVALLLWDSSPADSRPTDDTVVGPRTGDSPSPRNRPPAGEGENDVLKALRNNGQGPVESRSKIRPVGTEEPAGDKADFPELDIEVFPLDSDAEPAEPPEQRPLPESGPSPDDDSPVPEDNRSLPENQPPAAGDVDEEESGALLPELRSQPML